MITSTSNLIKKDMTTADIADLRDGLTVWTTDYNQLDRLYVDTNSDNTIWIECFELLPIISYLAANGFSFKDWHKTGQYMKAIKPGMVMRYAKGYHHVCVHQTRNSYKIMLTLDMIEVYPHEFVSVH